MSARGKVVVERNSWLWRIYETWADRAGKHRAFVDLCHFMRVLLIFAPLRWFFQKTWRIKNFPIQPWAVTLTALIVALLAFLVRTFPEASWIFVQAFAIVSACASIIIAIVYLVARNWSDERQDKVLTVAKWTSLPLWGPFYVLIIAAEWFWERALVPLGDNVLGPAAWWFGTTTLFHVRTVPIKLWVLPSLLLVAVFTYFFPAVMAWAGFFLVCGLLAAVVLGGAGYGGVMLFRKWQEWEASKPLPTWDDKEERRKLIERHKRRERRWAWARLFWQWLVAKKQRICPIIETR